MNDIGREGPDDSIGSPPNQEGAPFSFPPGFEDRLNAFLEECVASINEATFWANLPMLLKSDSGLSEILKLGLESLRDQFEPDHASGNLPDEESPFDIADASIGEEENLKRIEERQIRLGKSHISDRVHREHDDAHNTAIADFLRIDMLPYLLKIAQGTSRNLINPQEILRRGYRAYFTKILASGAAIESLFPAAKSDSSETSENPESAEYAAEEAPIEPYDARKEFPPDAMRTIAQALASAGTRYLGGERPGFKAFPVEIPALEKFYAPEIFASVVGDPQFSTQVKTFFEETLSRAIEQNNFEHTLYAAEHLILLYPDQYNRASLTIGDSLSKFNIVDEALEEKLDTWLSNERYDLVFAGLLFSKFFSDPEKFSDRLEECRFPIAKFTEQLRTKTAHYIPHIKENLSFLRFGLYVSLLTNSVVIHSDRFELIAPDQK